jgi:hypothetical protein
MPTINGPYRDPERGRRQKRYRTPPALLRMRRQFTRERQLEMFRAVFSREPLADEELEGFVEEYLRERYNGVYDTA